MTDRTRRDLIVAATALAASVTAAGSGAATPANKASFPPIVHHVFFWLKRPDSKEDRAKLLAGLQTLAGIDSVRGIHIGVPAETEQRGVVDGSCVTGSGSLLELGSEGRVFARDAREPPLSWQK